MARVLDNALVARLYTDGRGERWGLAAETFASTLEAVIARRCPDAGRGELERFFASLHVEDLTLACACADGIEAAWEHFVLEYRPALYRAADALDATGGERDLADSLYADLFGLGGRGTQRRTISANCRAVPIGCLLRSSTIRRAIRRLNRSSP